MEQKKNHIKKMAQLRYRDEIISLHEQGLSIAEITQKINFRLARTKFQKTTLSRDTIHRIVKGKFSGKEK
jgi:hypothetical protein